MAIVIVAYTMYLYSVTILLNHKTIKKEFKNTPLGVTVLHYLQLIFTFMKKLFISFAVVALSATAIILTRTNGSMDEQFEANVEALATPEGSGGSCTGPKERDYIFSEPYCHSQNSYDCSDNQNCRS